MLRTGVILRFPTSNSIELVSALERTLDGISGIDYPLHWSYCVHALFGDTSKRADRVMKALRGRSDDNQAPIGFTGAYHPLLRVDELKKELQWSSRNPFNEDPTSVFDSMPQRLLFPYSVDLRRAPARSAYKRGPTIIAEDRSHELIYCVLQDRYTTLPAIHSTSLHPKQLRRQLLRLYRREEDERALILIDGLAAAEGTVSETLSVLDELRIRFPDFEIVSSEHWLPDSSGEWGDLHDIELRLLPVPVDPATRRSWSSMPRKQKGKKRLTNELIKQRLERLSIVDVEEKRGSFEPEPPVRAEERTLVADMSGDVLLAESELSVRFHQGTVVGVRRGNRSVDCPLPARSYVRFGGSTSEFTTVSSFSFEGPNARGLRVIQKLDTEGAAAPGQIVADFYFEDGEEDLLVSLTVAYPELKGAESLDGYALLEWPLFALTSEEHLDAICEYPDGERCRLQLKPQADPIQLFGSRFHFRVRDTVVRVHFDRPENALPEVLPVAFRKTKGLNVFCINPRGSYSQSPAAAFMGLAEQLHFSLNLVDAETSSDGISDGKKIPARPQR